MVVQAEIEVKRYAVSPAERAEGIRRIVGEPDEMGAPAPEPLIAPHEEARPYPVDALSPTIRAAVITYQRYGQQPVSLVASSALGVAALSTTRECCEGQTFGRTHFIKPRRDCPIG